MDFYIGTEFSKEFSFEDGRITHKLAKDLNVAFKDLDYGDRIRKLNINVICVSKGFEPFCVVRPLKISRKEPMLVYELKLDFESFKNADEEERKRILINEVFKTTKEVLMSKTIKGFEKEKFIEDLESYFKEQGYLKEKIV